jgi:hypothetical protein
MLLERCLQARSWHDTGTVLRQLRGIGLTHLRVLSLKGVKTFESLRDVEPELLEMWCHRSTPFGRELLNDLQRIPQYELTVVKEAEVCKSFTVLIWLRSH